MKKFIRKWSRQNFSRQITVVYTAIVVTMVLCIMGFTMLYLTRIMENKILDLFENALHQTALNLSTTLEAYNSSLNQVIVEQEFLEAVDGYETAYGYAEQELRLQLWDSLQTYQSYQPKVRCMVVRTEGGKVFSVDRLDEESLYQAPPQLYQEYFTKSQPGEETERRLLWIGTEYLDRKGTSDYYVFTLKRPLYNWYNNRYVGELYMGIDEEVLVGIEQEAKTAQSRDLFLIDESNRIVSHEKKAYIGQDAAGGGQRLVSGQCAGSPGCIPADEQLLHASHRLNHCPGDCGYVSHYLYVPAAVRCGPADCKCHGGH